MTKEELCQYAHLGTEIDLYQERLRECHADARTFEQASDVVKGSLTEFPYTIHSIRISSIQTLLDFQGEIQTLTQKIARLKRRRTNIEGYIANIRDSELRQIFMLRYIKGLSWEQIAEKITGAGDGSTERKKHDRFLKVSRFSRKSVL